MHALTATHATHIRGLQRRSVRERAGRFVAEGPRVVADALRGHMRVLVVVCTPATASLAQRWIDAGSLRAESVSLAGDALYATLTESAQPQGMLAVVQSQRTPLDALPIDAPILLLDRLQDPGNVGTLLRTLRATGGRSVIALSGTVDLFNPKVVRASAGSICHLHVATNVTEADALAWAHARSIPLLSLEMTGDSLFAAALDRARPGALVVGNEADGVSPALSEAATHRIAIPMLGGVESLNAAMAGSVALYDLLRRRVAGDGGGV